MARRLYNFETDAEEILKIFEELTDEDLAAVNLNLNEVEELDLVLVPPLDGEDSDKDDGKSDDEEEGYQSLGKKLLSGRGELNLRMEHEILDFSEMLFEGEVKVTSEPIVEPHIVIGEFETQRPNSTSRDPPTAKKPKTRHWEEKDLTFPVTAPDPRCDNQPDFISEIISHDFSPLDLFMHVMDENLVEFICNETVRYANSKGDLNYTVTADEMYKFLGILLLSGYVKLPSKKMYWQMREDSFNIMVSNCMSRNKFEKILRFIHFNDNSKIDDDKLYKIRPLILHFNKKFREMAQPLFQNYSIDEAMEPYFGRNSMKQFIRGKPIRFGYKLWCLNSSSGYLLHFIPYTGKSSREPGLPLGSSVVKSLAVDVVPSSSTIYIDNFFTSFRLLEELKEKNINVIGTIRANRVEKAPLHEMKGKPRGECHALTDSNGCITLIRWQDNSQVTVASNLDSDEINYSKSTCSRWSGIEKRKQQIPQPGLIKLYNAGMGGVDVFDQHRGKYRCRIRSNKWYWPLFRFMLNGTVVNLWILYRHKDPTITLLEFIRSIVCGLLTKNIKKKNAYLPVSTNPGPRTSTGSQIQYDQLNHLIVITTTQKRCRVCGKCTKYFCEKCGVGLHASECFKEYHTKK